MDAHPSEMSSILAGPKQYVIPVFQRFYSWKKEEWATLWADIIAINEEKDGRLTHFIGPFIIISKTRAHFSSSNFLVIDGQQRLITITVLLCALRDRARILTLDALAEHFETNSISFLDNRKNKQMKIVPRFRDRETLQKIVRGNQSLADEDSLMAEAYKFFAKQLESVGESQIGLWKPNAEETLMTLYQTIVDRLRLVMVTLDDYDSPSNIYESLNYKGDKLSDADLIRNYTFMQVLPEQQESFDSNTWKPFESLFEKNEKIDTSSLTDFYYRYLIAQTGYFPKNRLYVKFMEYLGERTVEGEINTLEVFISELRRFARYYIRIKNADAEEYGLRLAFERLALLELDTAIPLVLVLYNQYENEDSIERISLSEFVSMLQALESFIIRRSIFKLRTRGYGPDLAQAVSHLTDFEQFAEFLASKGWPSDDQIKETLIKFPIYHHEPKKSFLILYEIERAFGHREITRPADLTIEHVMPQNLNLMWREMLGPQAEEIHEKYVHTIGNLTLTGYNQTLRDHPFETKKKIFAESKLQLNSYFVQCAVWTEAQICARSAVLTDEFIKVWPRPVTNKSATVEPEAYQQSLW